MAPAPPLDQVRSRLEVAVRRDPCEANLEAYWRHLRRAGLVTAARPRLELPGTRVSWSRPWEVVARLEGRVVPPGEGAPALLESRAALRFSVPALRVGFRGWGAFGVPADEAAARRIQALVAAAADPATAAHVLEVPLVEFLADPAGWTATQVAVLEARLRRWELEVRGP